MTPHIRIHKDFTVQWGIFRKTGDGREEYNLEGKELVLQLQSPYRTENITDFTVRGNIIEWTYWGKDQKSLGSYSLILIENPDKKGMVTVDKVSAFVLVEHTEDETGNDECAVTIQTVSLESESAIISGMGGGGGPVDDELNPDSKNAISNRAVTRALETFDKTKQDTIEDLETIREGASKGATALQSVPAEYVTETELNNKGFATISEVEKKQDIIIDLDTIRAGALKGASALQSVPSEYVTDSELSSKGYATTSQVAAKQDKLVSGSNIKTINGQSIVGSGNIEIEGGSDIDPSNFATKDELKDKQDTIDDLADIRRGAALGATALQSVPAGYVTTTDLQTEIDLVETQITGVAAAIPQKTSQLNNDSGFATEEYVNAQVRSAIISALNTEV